MESDTISNNKKLMKRGKVIYLHNKFKNKKDLIVQFEREKYYNPRDAKRKKEYFFWYLAVLEQLIVLENICPPECIKFPPNFEYFDNLTTEKKKIKSAIETFSNNQKICFIEPSEIFIQNDDYELFDSIFQ